MASGILGTRKKRALLKRWTIVFLDESGAALTPLVGKTWAPRGQTPVLRHKMGRWTRVNMISAVTHTKKVYFNLQIGRAFRQPGIVRFLKHLLRWIPGDILVFWDQGGPHRGALLEEFLAGEPRVRIEKLPPYGFEYNPDEGVWDHLKWHQLRNYAPADTAALVVALRRGLRRIGRRPALVASFFEATKLPRSDVDMLLNQSGGL